MEQERDLREPLLNDLIRVFAAEAGRPQWTLAVLHNQAMVNRRAFHVLAVVDRTPQKILTLAPFFDMGGDFLVDVLLRLAQQTRAPATVIVERQLEFISLEFTKWAAWTVERVQFVTTSVIRQPVYGEPIESRLQRECLSQCRFQNLGQVARVLDDWRTHYNAQWDIDPDSPYVHRAKQPAMRREVRAIRNDALVRTASRLRGDG